MAIGSSYQYKSQEEIEIIRKNCLLVSATLAEVAKNIKPGVTGLELDTLAETFIRDHSSEPAFKGYPGSISDFPGTLCISFNEVIVHGIPDKREVKEGDILSVDCGVKMNGYFGDSAFTFAVGQISDEEMNLLVTTRECLDLAIAQAIAGNRLGDVGHAV